MNNAAVKMSVYVSVQVPAFNSLGHIPRNGSVGSHDNSMLNFLRICHTVFHSELHHLMFPPNECEMVLHCSFDLPFPNY